MNRRRFFGAVAFIALVGLVCFLGYQNYKLRHTPRSARIHSSRSIATRGEHVVRRGEYLKLIAAKYNVGWEAMLLANEEYLMEEYEKICTDLPDSYTDRPGRRGTFCNNRYRRPYGNTLVAGMRLAIPAENAPERIYDVVSSIKGNNIALVIDDTGSMANDRQMVSEWYLAAIRQGGKNITGVWLYADRQVRHYEAGSVNFSTAGGFENTFGALKEAADEHPDGIILVTDEPGDDWDWDEVDDLPPVVVHCLDSSAEPNMRRVAQLTSGKFVSGLN